MHYQALQAEYSEGLLARQVNNARNSAFTMRRSAGLQHVTGYQRNSFGQFSSSYGAPSSCSGTSNGIRLR
jgi:hypothetical protein